MTLKTILLSLCLLCWQIGALAQGRQSNKPPRVRTAPLHRVGEYPNRYASGTFKIPNIILEDVRPLEDGGIYILQLYDPKTKVRRGRAVRGEPFDTYDFLTCAGAGVGGPLMERREKWVNRRVNVYLIMQDVGLTVFVYAGYIERIELLDDKGKVVETIPSGG
jgi:hypothetical protein